MLPGQQLTTRQRVKGLGLYGLLFRGLGLGFRACFLGPILGPLIGLVEASGV